MAKNENIAAGTEFRAETSLPSSAESRDYFIIYDIQAIGNNVQNYCNSYNNNGQKSY